MERILWYLISVVIIVVLSIVSIKKKFSLKVSTYIIVGISIASELCKVFTHIEARYNAAGEYLGYYITPASLPFHLCSITIFLYFYLALSKNERMKQIIREFVTPIGIIGGICGIAFATSGTDFTQPYAYQCFIYHSGIVWYSIYLMVSRNVRLTKAVYFRNLVILFALSIIVIWINGSLYINAYTNGNSINFMFLAKPPVKNMPFLNTNHGWFVYYIHLMCTGIILTLLLSLHDIIEERKLERIKEN